MPNTHKMDIDHLKYIKYHWFWGLTYSSTPSANNLKTQLDELLEDSARIARLIENQRKVADYSAIVRFFYWLFNINNTTHDAYLLMAYQAFKQSILENKGNMEQSNNLLIYGGIGLLAYASAKILSCYNFCESLVLSSKKQEEPELKDENEHEKQQNKGPTNENKHTKEQTLKQTTINQPDSFIVTCLMVDPLEVLGIKKEIGQELSMTEFKTAARKKYLQAHPDKGGSKEAFCEVKKAVELIHQMISTSEDETNDLEAFWNHLDAELEKYLKQLSSFDTELKQSGAGINNLRKDLFVYQQETNEKFAILEAYIEKANVSDQATLGIFAPTMVQTTDLAPINNQTSAQLNPA